MPQDDAVHFARCTDVVQALLNPQLVPHGSVNTTAAPLCDLRLAPSSASTTASSTAPSIAPDAAMRAAVHQALAPAQLAIWRAAFAAQAQALVGALPDGMPVDLVTGLAEPWSLGLALVVTGVPQEHAAQCESLARRIYFAAAHARDGRPAPDCVAAATALAQVLSGLPSRTAAIADVQTFVALSQTLPALLAGAWRVLMAQPEVLAQLLLQPQRVAGYAGELLRLGSPARAVFRQAAEDLSIGSHHLRRGDSVALLIGAANRDPTHFPHPERLDPARDTSAQLGLGLGLHHCAGASLVRMALIVGTQALLEGCTSLALLDAAESATLWRGGFAMRAPASLLVVRQR